MTLDELAEINVDRLGEEEVRNLAKFLQEYVGAWAMWVKRNPGGPWDMGYVVEWARREMGK